MRILYAILLFTTIATKPAIELSNVMYYQLNIDTIVEKYCVNKKRPRLNCNGKCYLMKQMASKNTSQKETSKFVFSSEVFIPVFFEAYKTIQFLNKTQYSSTFKRGKINQFYIRSICSDIDHPPQIA